MNMYEAVKLAAAHIAAKPQLYSFAVTHIPHDDGTDGLRNPVSLQLYSQMGCMLGRIGAIVGFKSGAHRATVMHSDADEVAHRALGLGHQGHKTFFDRIVQLQLEVRPYIASDLHDPAKVAPAMAAYAERYRAELEARVWPREGIPHAVRKIFRPQYDALLSPPLYELVT